MKKRQCPLLLSFFFWILIFLPRSSWSQLVLGQYEDEAPFRTWNSFGFATAPSLGFGDVHFTLALDSSASLSNPALLFLLPKLAFTLNSSFNSASFFKYSLVNTGVLSTEKNLSHGFYALDFGGFSVRLKNWAFSLSLALVETYDRPKTKYEYYFKSNLSYFINLIQRGVLKNMNFSLSRKVFRRLFVGLGFNFIYGDLKRDVTEKWVDENITISDSIIQKFKGFFLNGGLWLELSDKLAAAAVFRTSFTKKSESQSLLRFSSPSGGTDIKIEASSEDEYKQPFVIGIGASYTYSHELRVASDLAYYNWSKYEVSYFEETKERNFKDVVKIGVGVEYLSSISLFNQKFNFPFRMGISYDPQPMKVPNSSYFYYSFGIGLHWNKLLLDAGTLIGKESGSGNSLAARKVVLSLSFQL